MKHLDRFLHLLLPSDAAESLGGDLHEEMERSIVPRFGRATGVMWLAAQAIALVLRFLASHACSWMAPSQWRGFAGDLRFATRSLRKRPGFLAIVLTTLEFLILKSIGV